MGGILSTANTHVQHVLYKNNNIVQEISTVANYTKVSCDRYVRQPYFEPNSYMVLPDIKEESDDLRIITTGVPYCSKNSAESPYHSDNAPVDGWQEEYPFLDDNGKPVLDANGHPVITTRTFPGAFAYYGTEHSPQQLAQLVSFTTCGRMYKNGGYLLTVDNSPAQSELEYPYDVPSVNTRLVDYELFRLPENGFNAYDLPVINSEHEDASFYHVSLRREFTFVFRREIYQPFIPSDEPLNPDSTSFFLGDVQPTFFYLDGFAYKPFLKSFPETILLCRMTVKQSTISFPDNGVMPIMRSYVVDPMKTSSIAANLSFVRELDYLELLDSMGAEDKPLVELQEDAFKYAPMWFQWYQAAPLKMAAGVAFTDAKGGKYPTYGKVPRIEPGYGCSVPFVYSGHPSESMLMPLRFVWDVPQKSDVSEPVISSDYTPPSDYLLIYPYVNDGTLRSYENNPSHYPLVRFECEFLTPESPTHVEVIPAWQNMSEVPTKDDLGKSRFPSIKPNSTVDYTPEVFYNELDAMKGSFFAPVMPKHVLLEGKLLADGRYEVLDVIELPFSYHELPYPLYKLCYKRKIKYLRFTIMSIYMSMDKYPNELYTHLYFPKMDFFTKPEN
jgi:hypothetical protein